uniref:Carbonic anhydrase n=1 Tax=Ciona savignyi TaxID=51511 RepID=H2YZZ8_CIOSA
MFKLAALFVIFTFTECTYGATWVYSQGPYGPENWLNSYDACGTMSQSPIDIVHGATVADEKLGKFNRTTFTAIPDKMTLLNNGHALQVNLEGGYTVSDRNVLPGDYQAFQFHLHWAAVNQSRGSEHWIDGKQYFAELHIVHYNTKYASIGEALTQHEGLAVLGVFVAIGSETNENIDLLLNPIAQIQQYNQQMIYSSKFDIGRFLPEDLENYYRYSGSLTTPPCFESVVWTVFNEPIYISRAQAETLQTSLYARANSTDLVGGNYRLPQPLHDRKISRPGKSGASPLTSTILLHVTSMLVTAYALRF